MATIRGTNARNTLRGTNLRDTILGLGANDALFGLLGNDLLLGGLGNDTLDGGAGDDTLKGEAGNDRLLGGAGRDQLDGGANNDYLDGGLGSDVMKGGAGNDTFVVNTSGDTTSDTGGVDTVRSSVSRTLGTGLEKLTLTGTANMNATGNALANTLAGNSGNNTINGGAGDDTMTGGSGNDTFHVDSVNDVATDSAGIDTVISAVDYTLGNGIENLILTTGINGTGNALANTITGNTAANSLSGGDGNDTLIGGGGADSLDGAAGNADIASYENSVGAVRALLQAFLIFNNSGDAQGDVYTEIEGIRGTNNTTDTAIFLQHGPLSMQDMLGGNADDNIIEGLAGNDLLIGGGGGDTLNGGSGEDAAGYLSSVISITVSLLNPANNTGDAQNDVYISIENLIGTRHNGGDVLTGNTGANRLFGMNGADTLNGGDGDDWLVPDTAFADVLTVTDGDVINGGTGSDTIDYSGSQNAIDGITIDLFNQFIFGGEAETDTISSIENFIGTKADDDVIASAAANHIDGGNGNDGVSYAFSNAPVTINLQTQTVSGGFASGDTIVSIEHATGSNFADVITGTATGSRLSGGGGADTLTGGAGNDRLTGGGGDLLTGGAGDDTYVIDADDTIVETGSGGTDRVIVSHSYTLVDNIEDGEIAENNFDAVNLTGNSGNNILTGAGGANRLDGGGGDDTMIGLDGSDTYIVNSAGDVVEEFGFGNGTDLVEASVTYTDTFGGIEDITLTGTGNIDATANASSNVLIGNSGNNTLDGLAGEDTLTGGGGIDRFKLHADGAKTITDFIQGTDLLQFSLADLPMGSGLVDGLTFFNNATAAQGGAGNGEIFFDNANSTLYFDADGNAGGEIVIAVLSGFTSNLAISDFDVLAIA